MRKPFLYRAAAILASALLGAGALAPAANADLGNGGNGNPGQKCVTAAAAKYSSTFDGPSGDATVTIENGPLCAGEEQAFALVSYTAPSATFALPQYVMAQDVKSFVGPDGNGVEFTTKTFHVTVPTCFAQVDLVRGADVINPLTSASNLYGDRKLNFWNGGKGTCEAKPAVESLSDCDGNVTLSLINREDGNLAAVFEVTGDAGFTRTVTVAPGKMTSLEVPAASAKAIVVKANGTELYRGGWKEPEGCEPPPAGKPVVSVQSDCAGLEFAIRNPSDGVPVTVTLTPNKGTTSARTVTLQPGESKTGILFPAETGLTVAVGGDVEAQTVAWVKPSDCPSSGPSGSASPSPSASPSASTPGDVAVAPSTTPASGPGALAKTGSATAPLAVGAVLVVLAGAVVFVLFRRRKLKFTA